MWLKAEHTHVIIFKIKKRRLSGSKQVTEDGVVSGQPVEPGVERADEEIMSELHYGQPQQMPEEEPGQNTALETRH